MKKIMNEPSVKVVKIEKQDIIATSGDTPHVTLSGFSDGGYIGGFSNNNN